MELKIMDQIKDADAVKVGDTIYHVHALGQSSYMSTLFVVEAPHNKGGMVNGKVSKFIKVATAYSSFYRDGVKVAIHDASLLDMNIQQNDYNKHKSFSTKGSAVAYMNYCKVLNIDLGSRWNRVSMV